jgi:hypothetical protein
MKKLTGVTLICLLFSVNIFASTTKVLTGISLILISVYGGEHQFNLRDKSNDAKAASNNAFVLSDTYKISDPTLSANYLNSANSLKNDSDNYKKDMEIYQGASASCLAVGAYLITDSIIKYRKKNYPNSKFNPYQFFGGFAALGFSAITYDKAKNDTNVSIRTMDVFATSAFFVLGVTCISNNIDILVSPKNVTLSYKF